jgi:hypothetical protein
MEIVELYCELLLARANVLDQIAFGEGGAKIRARGKEVLKRVNAPAGQGRSGQGGRPSSTAEKGAGAGIGFPFRGLGRKQESHPETTSQGQAQDEEEEGDGDEESYINPPLDEAAVSIFYAWSRFPHDIRELTILRTLLAERWGKEFMALAQDNKVEGARVPERLAKGLRVRAPSRELVESYLREIARAYGVSYPEGEGEGPGKPPGEPSGEFGGGGDGGMGGDGDGDGGGDIQNPPPSTSTPDTTRRPSDPADLSTYSPPRGLHAGRSPVSVAPPAARTDNPRPRVKLPDAGPETGTGAAENEVAPSASGTGGSGGIPEVDELSRRFAALRR